MNTTNASHFAAALPAIAASYVARCAAAFAACVAAFGTDRKTLRRGAAASCSHAAAFALCERYIGRDAVVVFDRAQAEADAVRFAADCVAEFDAKINEKTGGITGATVQHVDGATFVITGKRGADVVTIEQTMIVNVSSKGKVFNQFPATLAVNGKRISAAAFARLA